MARWPDDRRATLWTLLLTFVATPVLFYLAWLWVRGG